MRELLPDADGLLGGECGLFRHVVVLVQVHVYGCMVCCLFVCFILSYSQTRAFVFHIVSL